MLLCLLLTWNGTPIQRESARRLFPFVTAFARKITLLRVSADPSLYSVLHQPNLSFHNFNPPQFDWTVWIEQEKRIRLMYLIYLCDCAMDLYFNSPPQIDNMEMRIPLPADDAAWEAQSAVECAEALCLHGPDAAKARNSDGSQRTKQPEMDLALKTLMHGSYQIQPGSTNLYGKFILIHALSHQVLKLYREGSNYASQDYGTPLSQNDWIVAGGEPGSGNASANNSGRGTPISGVGPTIAPQALKVMSTALDKFKANWDMDMAIQFPPSYRNPRRYGFCRDGIHFFWLARWMLKYTKPADIQNPPDQRFTQVIHLLKSVKQWVQSDGAQRGEELALGSVGDIDQGYGLSDLTLDFVQLFQPLPAVSDAPNHPTVKTDI